MMKTRMLQNLLAKFLILLMVLTNTVLPIAQAADAAEQTAMKQEQVVAQETEPKADDPTILTVDKSQASQTIQAATTEDIGGNSKTTNTDKAFQFGNKLFSYYVKDSQKKGPEWLKTTDFQIYFSKHNSPVYWLETVQPLGKVNQNGQQWFWQGRYARESASASTGNIGLGWRNLAEDKSSLIGMNVFYDYGFEYNLKRLGVGMEYFNKLVEYRMNWYYPVSGDRLTDVTYKTDGILYSYIRAVEGLDYEVGTSFTHIPWLRAYAGGYYWNNKYRGDEIGYKLRTTMQLTPRIELETGYSHSNLTHEPYFQLTYKLASDKVTALWNGVKATETKACEVTNKMLQKVARQNDIKTETYTKFVAYAGRNITVKVTDSNGNAVSGASVQAHKGGVAIASPAVTDGSGTATISGLSAGAYTLTATYTLNGTMYTATSAVVNVQNGDVAATVQFTVPIATTLYITATAGTNGTITYGTSGTIAAGTTASIPVAYGASLTLNFVPATHYKVANVTVGGAAEGATTSYTLSNITSSVAVSSFYTEITYDLTVTAVGNQLEIQVYDNTTGSYNQYTVTHGNTYTVPLHSSHEYVVYLLYNYTTGYQNLVTLLYGHATGNTSYTY